MDQKTLESLKKEKNAVILAHYYVSGTVQTAADYVGDSFTLAKLATRIDANKDLDREVHIIITEEGICYELEKTYPDRTFIFPDLICAGMKQVHLDDIIDILKTGKNEVHVDPSLAERAKLPLTRMLAICG
ncbi:quinolinate synthase NadA [Peptococcus simiae]|uniref:quinolinate synthase NadA n=1 Tax=Peptococcus simiae TaxID=1643805 RepID=UPI00397F4CDD